MFHCGEAGFILWEWFIIKFSYTPNAKRGTREWMSDANVASCEDLNIVKYMWFEIKLLVVWDR